MNKSVSKIRLTRAGAFIIAVITLLLSIAVLPVGAQTGDTATITFDYNYDTGDNVITFVQTVTNGDVTVGTPGEELCRIYANGKDAYCIQPGYHLYSGNELTEGYSSVWNNISADKRKAVNIALLYGKPGSEDQLEGSGGQKWIATQLIVWELITGCRDTGAGFKLTNSKFIDSLTADGNNPGVKYVYNCIVDAMANHHTVPSFAANLVSKAPTHTMQYKDGVYTVTLTDSNGVLNKFNYKSDDSITVKASGNSLTLSSNSPITDEKTLSVNKKVPSVSDNSVLVAFGDSEKQDVIVGLAAPDPVPSVFKLKTDAGNLKIVKTSEDGNIGGVEFNVKGANFDKNVKTNDKGEIILSGLVPGTYTVTEASSDRYVEQPAQTVTVENGKTAEVSFKNVLKKSEIIIVKKDAESKKTIPLAGFGFKIQKSDGSYVTVDNKDVFYTDKTGTVKFPVKLIYGSYQLIEVQAGTGYVLDSTPVSFTVDGTKTTIELEKLNYTEKGTITIYKSGDIFTSVTEEKLNGDDPESATENSEETEPLMPTEPSKPAEPARPTEPSVPDASGTPDREKPNQPEAPTAPSAPSAPTEPAAPEKTEPSSDEKPTESAEPAEEKLPAVRYIPVFENGSLADAEFTVTAAEDITTPDGTVHCKKGDVVDTVTTDENGIARTKKLYLGKYVITESKSPYGYVSNPEAYTVEITYAGQNVKVTNTDLKVENIRQKAEITLQKVLEKYDLLGIGDSGEIENVAFALFADEDITAADGKSIPKDGLIEIIHCDENDSVKFNTEIPFGKYYVQEYSTDSRYIIDDTKYPFEFAYTPDTDVQHFDISDGTAFVNSLKRGTVTTTKVDEEYPDNKLTGAVFEIYADADGDKQFNPDVDKLVGEMTESAEDIGVYFLTDLPVGGFFLYEKEAPKGFEKDNDYYYFEIAEDGDIVSVENKAGVGFTNKPTTGELEITKKDVADGKLLPKAGFRIKDAEGNVIAEGYTDENGIAKFRLRAGKYSYEEFDAPEGYIIDTTPHEFKITEDGQIVKAEMTNEKEIPPETPQTGDTSKSGFFIGLGALALGGLIACLILFLKKKKDDGDDD